MIALQALLFASLAIANPTANSLIFDPPTLDLAAGVNTFTVRMAREPSQYAKSSVTFVANGLTFNDCSVEFTKENYDQPQEVSLQVEPSFTRTGNEPIEIKANLCAPNTTVLNEEVAYPANHNYHPGGKCVSWGDPHYEPFSGPEKFNFQGIGKFYMIKDTKINLQVDLQKCNGDKTCNKRAALRYGKTAVIFYSNDASELQVEALTAENTEELAVKKQNGNAYDIELGDGSKIAVTAHHAKRIDITITLAGGLYGDAAGLCNVLRDAGDNSQTLVKKDGSETTDENEFGDSWNVLDDDDMFEGKVVVPEGATQVPNTCAAICTADPVCEEYVHPCLTLDECPAIPETFSCEVGKKVHVSELTCDVCPQASCVVDEEYEKCQAFKATCNPEPLVYCAEDELPHFSECTCDQCPVGSCVKNPDYVPPPPPSTSASVAPTASSICYTGTVQIEPTASVVEYSVSVPAPTNVPSSAVQPQQTTRPSPPKRNDGCLTGLKPYTPQPSSNLLDASDNSGDFTPLPYEEAKKQCEFVMGDNSCATVANKEFYADACGKDYSTSGDPSYLESVRLSYNTDCRISVGYQQFDPSPEVRQQAQNIKEECGLGAETKCELDCSGNGQCSSNACLCNDGFTGNGCQYRLQEVQSGLAQERAALEEARATSGGEKIVVVGTLVFGIVVMLLL